MPPDSQPSPRTPADPLNLNSLRILLVDDEPQILEIVGDYLRCEGHRVDCVPSGKAAMDKLRSKHYDVLITDYLMEEMSGGDLIRALKEDPSPNDYVSTLSIIVLSALGDEFKKKGKEVPGADLILSKPMSLDGLKKQVLDTVAFKINELKEQL